MNDWRREQKLMNFGVLLIYLALAGLVVLAFNHGTFFVITEALLLIAAGTGVIDWLKRYANDRQRAVILHSGLNLLLFVLAGWATVIGGLILLWNGDQLIACCCLTAMFIRNLIKSHQGSDRRAIKQIVDVYRRLQRTYPHKSEGELCDLVAGTVLQHWGAPEWSIENMIEKHHKESIHEVIRSLLLFRDVSTGRPMSNDLNEVLSRYKKRQEQEQFVDELLVR